MNRQTPGQTEFRPSKAGRRPEKVPRSILVVDDDPDICRLNSEVLVNSGYHVDAVGDGEFAFQALRLNRYDLVVTDNKMPRCTGIELLRRLHASKKAVPVIMATGTFPSVEFEMEPWIKPPLVLLKPYSIGELLEAVQTVLGEPGVASADSPRAAAKAAGLSLKNAFEPGVPVVIPIQNRASSQPGEFGK